MQTVAQTAVLAYNHRSQKKETHRVIAAKPVTMRLTVSENPPHRAVFCMQIITLETFGVNNLACWRGGRTWCYR